MKRFQIFFIAIISFLESQQGSAHSIEIQEDVKKSLIQITQKLQNYEMNLSGVEKELKLLKNKEREVFALVARQQHILVSTLQSLKHWREYSPILIALSSVSLDDLVHSFLILQSCAPKLERQNRSILDALKKVVELRSQIQKHNDDYIKLKGYYQESLKSQADLFETKFQEYPLPETPEIKKLQEIAKEFKTASLQEVLTQLSSFFSKTEDKKDPELKLIHVAVGESFQSCKGSSCLPGGTKNDLAIKVSTRGEAQVVSPCDAMVVYIGSAAEKSQLIILKKDEYFVVISGLGSVNCRIGESVQEGEPIGCALSWAANEFRTDFKSEEKVINLQLARGLQFIDSTPYLRHTSNDKKI